MHLLCVIPARVGSQRLPEKPLRHIAGMPLVCRVARRVAGLGLGGQVVVATDDFRVVRVANEAGFDAIMTRRNHGSGTERIAEVLTRPEYSGVDVVLNVQGDEPFVPSEADRKSTRLNSSHIHLSRM